MVRSIRTTNPALIRCSPASGRPRSANTLPVLGSRSRVSLFGILYLVSQLSEPLADQFHLRFRRRNSSLGFFLERVDHVNRFTNRDGIDRAAGSAGMVGGNLHHLSPKTMQRLGLGTHFAQRGSVQRIADVVLDASRKRLHLERESAIHVRSFIHWYMP